MFKFGCSKYSFYICSKLNNKTYTMKKAVLDTKFIHSAWFKSYNEVTKRFESYLTKKEALMFFGFCPDTYLTDTHNGTYLHCGREKYRYKLLAEELVFLNECFEVKREYLKKLEVLKFSFNFNEKMLVTKTYVDVEKLSSDFFKYVVDNLKTSSELMLACFKQLDEYRILV